MVATKIFPLEKCLRIKLGAIAALTAALVLPGCSGDEPHHSVNKTQDAVQTASLSAEGNYVLLAKDEAPLELWDLKNQRVVSILEGIPAQKNIHHASLSPDGRFALTANTHTLILWDNNTGEPVAAWAHPETIQDIAISRFGQKILVGLSNNHAQFIKVGQTQAFPPLEHDDQITVVTISQDGQYMLTGSKDKSAKIWSAQDGRLLHAWAHDSEIKTAALSPDNRYAFTSDGKGHSKIWEIKSGKLLQDLNNQPRVVTIAAFSPSGRYLVTGTDPEILQLWHVPTGEYITQWRLPKKDLMKPTTGTIHSVAFSKDEKKIFSEDSYGVGYVWTIP